MNPWDGASEMHAVCRAWAHAEAPALFDFILRELDDEKLRQAYIDWGMNPERLVNLLLKGLDGPTFWVAEDLAVLIEGAAESLPAETLRTDDPFSPNGWCQWPHPREAVDEGGRRSSYRAISWWFEDGVLWYVRWIKPSDNSITTLPADWPLVGLFPSAWQVGQDWGLVEEREVHRLLKAFWAIVSQPLPAVITERSASRAERRRAEREARRLDPVRVIELRRRESGSATDEHSPVDWSHRWLVSGHWRNQWLPSKETHRLQFIAPYIKGPDDKPFVPKDVLYRVDR